MNPVLLAALPLTLTSAPSSGDRDWPQFRGPHGTGAVPAAKIPLEWSADKNVAWKVAIPGQGWSQAVVFDGMVYVTTATGEGLETPMAMQAGIADPRTMKAGEVPDV